MQSLISYPNTPPKPRVIKYPWIGKFKNPYKYPEYENRIVLFISERTGFPISGWELVDYSTSWIMDQFEEFDGQVLLKNDGV